MTVGYQGSFNDKNIAKTLFGTDTLHFQGSYVTDRASTSLVADYFGLSDTFDGSLHIKPSIYNVNVNFGGFLGLDEWVEGLWTSLDFTFAHQGRKLEACPTGTLINGLDYFEAGYMATTTAATTSSMKTALGGQFLFGDMQTPWAFGRFDFCTRSANKVASVDINVGYDFLNCEDYRFGAYFRFGIPTGTKIDCDYAKHIFNPVVGNGHHWELGGGITSAYELWNCDGDQNITAYLDGYLVTLLKNHQVRSFDIIQTNTITPQCSALSRYGLMKQLTADVAPLNYAYAGSLINAINFTTRCTEVSVALKGDATLRFVYRNGGWDLGFGYNFFGQSHDKVCIKAAKSPCSGVVDADVYGLKGTEGVAYWTYNDIDQDYTNEVPYNATNRDASIFDGGTQDNPYLDGTPGQPWDSFNIVYPSAPAVPLNATTDLFKKSGVNHHLISNKGFINSHYTWADCDWTPYIGAYVEVEGASRNSLSLWGVAVQGGISF